MSEHVCAVKGCPREATHSLELEHETIHLCCECAHGSDRPLKTLVLAECTA